jgi:hypothetical protein
MSTSQLELEGVAVAAEPSAGLRETTESDQRNVSAREIEVRGLIKPALRAKRRPAGRSFSSRCSPSPKRRALWEFHSVNFDGLSMAGNLLS